MKIEIEVIDNAMPMLIKHLKTGPHAFPGPLSPKLAVYLLFLAGAGALRSGGSMAVGALIAEVAGPELVTPAQDDTQWNWLHNRTTQAPGKPAGSASGGFLASVAGITDK